MELKISGGIHVMFLREKLLNDKEQAEKEYNQATQAVQGDPSSEELFLAQTVAGVKCDTLGIYKVLMDMIDGDVVLDLESAGAERITFRDIPRTWSIGSPGIADYLDSACIREISLIRNPADHNEHALMIVYDFSQGLIATIWGMRYAYLSASYLFLDLATFEEGASAGELVQRHLVQAKPVGFCQGLVFRSAPVRIPVVNDQALPARHILSLVHAHLITEGRLVDGFLNWDDKELIVSLAKLTLPDWWEKVRE